VNSCLYFGAVHHQRRTPRPHDFDYRLFLVGLDLDELDDVFRGRWLWSTRRPAVAWFRRRDFLGPAEVPLRQAVADRVRSATGRELDGPIQLVTHLRYLGISFNPVSFYLCFDAAGEQLCAVVAEITNTPWNERHAYVLDRDDAQLRDGGLRWRFPKEFHVSPFLDMDYVYVWWFQASAGGLLVHMENRRGDRLDFTSTLRLARRPLTGGWLARALLGHPWMSAKVVAAIYWQALRLWWKRTPFFPHPRKRPAPAPVLEDAR